MPSKTTQQGNDVLKHLTIVKVQPIFNLKDKQYLPNETEAGRCFIAVLISNRYLLTQYFNLYDIKRHILCTHIMILLYSNLLIKEQIKVQAPLITDIQHNIVLIKLQNQVKIDACNYDERALNLFVEKLFCNYRKQQYYIYPYFKVIQSQNIKDIKIRWAYLSKNYKKNKFQGIVKVGPILVVRNQSDVAEFSLLGFFKRYISFKTMVYLNETLYRQLMHLIRVQYPPVNNEGYLNMLQNYPLNMVYRQQQQQPFKTEGEQYVMMKLLPKSEQHPYAKLKLSYQEQ